MFCKSQSLLYNKLMDTSRNELLIGQDGQQKLKDSNIAIVGVGGVGGYVATMLVRAGVENLTIVDFDRVSSSNLNRQVVALESTIGEFKVEVLKKQLLEINSCLKITAIKNRLTQENVSQIITAQFDYVVDCIDSVPDKIALIVFCKKNNIKIISAMGAGNRTSIPRFILTDIYKTHDDGLAKAVRKKLRIEGVENLEVVTCEDKALRGGGTVGSISYLPAMCGITLAAVIINKILEEKK